MKLFSYCAHQKIFYKTNNENNEILTRTINNTTQDNLYRHKNTEEIMQKKNTESASSTRTNILNE